MIIFTIFLTGCWDTTEPQRMYYINAVGVDFNDNQYEVYLQIINFADLAKSEQPNPDIVPTEVGYAKGKTIEEAIFKLYRSIDQKIFWGHMRYLIFSVRAMENERSIPVIDTFIRFRDTRYQIWIYSTENSINDVLLATPILKNSLASSKLSNPINPTKQESFIEPINLRDIAIGLNEPSHEISIPFVDFNKEWETAEGQTEATSFAGVSILSKDGFKGIIKGSAARGNQWMHNYTNQAEVTFKLDTNERDYITVTLDKLKVKVKPIVTGQQIRFEAEIKLRAKVNGFKGAVTTKELRDKIVTEVKKEIKETYEEGLKLDVDIYRLSEHLYRRNVKAWKKYEANGKIPLTKDSLSKIDIHVDKIYLGNKTFEETIEE